MTNNILNLVFEIECYEIIEKYTNNSYINWNAISDCEISKTFIKKYDEQLNWIILSSNDVIFKYNDNYDFFITFESKLNWNIISRVPMLDEYFIETFKHKVNWISIFEVQYNEYKSISIEFIKKHKNIIIWNFFDYFCEEMGCYNGKSLLKILAFL